MTPRLSWPLAAAVALLVCRAPLAQGLGSAPDPRFLVPADAALQLSVVVNTVGTPALAPVPVRAGNDEPLTAALRAIVPRGYNVVMGGGVLETQRTSWPASAQWTAALGAALRPLHLRAVVAHDAQEVMVTVGARVNDEQRRPWQILVGEGTVRRALARWTAAAGLTLTWESAGPVPVRADWSHTGTLDEALEALGTDLAASEVPLCLRRYTNGVLRVTTAEQCPVESQARPALRPATAPAAPAAARPARAVRPAAPPLNPTEAPGGA